MKTIRRSFLIAALAVPGLFGAARAGEYGLLPESRLGLSGDSTLHPYHSKATGLKAVLDVTGGLDTLPPPNELRSFVLEVDVQGLKSGKDGLDKKMYESLKASEHPAIRFTLKEWSADPCCADEAGTLPLKARGVLSVAGVEKEIVLEGRLGFRPGRLAVSGKYDLLMSDYGIKPPKMMMGAVKTQDKVTIDFTVFIGSTQTQQPGGNDNEGQ